MELVMEAVLGAAFGLAGGFALVAMLNGLAMPGGLHPLFVVAGAVTISAVTSLVGGSGLLAVYIAGLVMANRPVRAYPSIVGFHDAVTWLCQIVMFLMLGLLVTPSTLWDYAPQGLLVAAVLTLVARPLAVWICTLGVRLRGSGRRSSSPGWACAGRCRSSSRPSRCSPACRTPRPISTSPSSSCSSPCWCRARR